MHIDEITKTALLARLKKRFGGRAAIGNAEYLPAEPIGHLDVFQLEAVGGRELSPGQSDLVGLTVLFPPMVHSDGDLHFVFGIMATIIADDFAAAELMAKQHDA